LFRTILLAPARVQGPLRDVTDTRKGHAAFTSIAISGGVAGCSQIFQIQLLVSRYFGILALLVTIIYRMIIQRYLEVFMNPLTQHFCPPCLSRRSIRFSPKPTPRPAPSPLRNGGSTASWTALRLPGGALRLALPG
jgi:hypothetical protein